jgi:hypothetical protein
MEENITQQSKLKIFLNSLMGNKKYLLFFLSTGIVLIIIIVWMLILITTNRVGSPSQSTQTTVATPTTPTTPQLTISPTTTSGTIPSSAETTSIKNLTKPQIENLTNNASYDVSKIETYTSNWAIIKITSNDGNDAVVVVKKENNIWKVMLGPGTFFDDQDLINVGAPQDLINEVNSTF